MITSESAVLTTEEAQKLSESLWENFYKQGVGGLGYYRCLIHIGIKYPPNYSGNCPVCGQELTHHTGF